MNAVLEDEHEALLQFLYLAPIGLVQTNADGDIAMINPVCAQLLLPLSPDGGLTNLFATLQSAAPDLRHRARDFQHSHGLVCSALHLHVQVGAAGKTQPRILSLSLLKLDEERLMAVLDDVTLAVQRERELQRSQAWFQALISGLADYALITLDAQGRCLEWNRGVERVTGFDERATAGSAYAMFYPPGAMSAQGVLDRIQDADASGWSLDEGWRVRADGTRYWGSCLIAPMQDPGATPADARCYSLIVRDISAHREASEAARRALSCDYLTGLANRRVLFEAAELALHHWQRTPRPLALVMVDADHFKQINDRHGHAAGDAVLRHLATALAASFPSSATIARVGGEEFVVLMPGAERDAAEAAAVRLCESMASQSVSVDGTAIRCTVSAGVATMAPDILDVDGLLRRADAAMYAAKARGRNRVITWHPSLGLVRPGPGAPAQVA